MDVKRILARSRLKVACELKVAHALKLTGRWRVQGEFILKVNESRVSLRKTENDLETNR